MPSRPAPWLTRANASGETRRWLSRIWGPWANTGVLAGEPRYGAGPVPGSGSVSSPTVSSSRRTLSSSTATRALYWLARAARTRPRYRANVWRRPWELVLRRELMVAISMVEVRSRPATAAARAPSTPHGARPTSCSVLSPALPPGTSSRMVATTSPASSETAMYTELSPYGPYSSSSSARELPYQRWKTSASQSRADSSRSPWTSKVSHASSDIRTPCRRRRGSRTTPG